MTINIEIQLGSSDVVTLQKLANKLGLSIPEYVTILTVNCIDNL